MLCVVDTFAVMTVYVPIVCHMYTANLSQNLTYSLTRFMKDCWRKPGQFSIGVTGDPLLIFFPHIDDQYSLMRIIQ